MSDAIDSLFRLADTLTETTYPDEDAPDIYGVGVDNEDSPGITVLVHNGFVVACEVTPRTFNTYIGDTEAFTYVLNSVIMSAFDAYDEAALTGDIITID